VHASHLGGGYDAGNMTGAYFWKILFKTQKQIPPDAVKLLDTKEMFTGERKDVKTIYTKTFESDTTEGVYLDSVINKKYFKLSQNVQFSPKYTLNVSKNDGTWVRVSATFRCPQKEWDIWKMTQMILRFYQGEKVIKEGVLRAQRFLNDGETKTLFLEATIPKKAFDKAEIYFWNAESDKTILIENITVEAFNAQ
jgi:hypothetical protein